MTKYQLAKVIEMAGKIETRKSLQKVVFLLKVAGCPLDIDYHLHYYGPYSKDLADLVNEMASQRLLEEATSQNGAGTQYSYALSDRVLGSLKAWELTESGRRAAERMDSFRPLLKELLSHSPRELELASTIAFYQQRYPNDWSKALKDASDFKNEPEGSPAMKKAEQLAREVVVRKPVTS